MARPALAFLVILALFIGIAAYTSSLHQAEPTVGEKADKAERDEMEKAMKEAEKKKKEAPKMSETQRLTAFDAVKEGAIRATLEIEGRGKMTLELYPKAAPETVKHFVELCKQNFYDGILFHRVVPDFVVQGGDPKTKTLTDDQRKALKTDEDAQRLGLGVSGSGKSVPLEAKLPHLAYSVGLARSQSPDSGDSQFYINLKDNGNLDGNYCVFGRVVEGEDVASKIQMGDKITHLSINP